MHTTEKARAASSGGNNPSRPALLRHAGTLLSHLPSFLVLFGLWLMLSGMFDAFHIALGVLSSAFVVWISHEFFPPEMRLLLRARSLFGLLAFIPWLLWEIAKANVAMLRLVFRKDINSHIEPQIVHLTTTLRNPLALTIFANSITLTPGTITVSIKSTGEFSVHAIDGNSAKNLPGEMERKIARIFGES